MNFSSEIKASIEYEVEISHKDNKSYHIVGFYDGQHICYGDFDISNMDIYEVTNPYFLSDTFIFCKKHYENVFLVGKCDLIPYIKVNYRNQIEEIGNNFAERFHFTEYDELLQRKDVKPAEPIHKILFCTISDEYWLKGIANKVNNKTY